MKIITLNSPEKWLKESNDSEDYDLIFIADQIYERINDKAKKGFIQWCDIQKISIILLVINQENISLLNHIFPIQLVPPIKRNNLLTVVRKGLNITDNYQQKNKRKQVKNDTNLARLFPANILVAEDNQVNQKLVKLVFKKMGYSIDIATNGLEVIEKIKFKKKSMI